jgi:hypothetical protein
MRYHVVRLLPSVGVVLLLVGLASCSPDTPTAPRKVTLVGTWLSTDEHIRLSLDVSKITDPDSPDSLSGEWHYQGQGSGSCEGTAVVDHFESSVLINMDGGDFCKVLFQGAITDDNTVKGLLNGNVTNVGTSSSESGSLLIELHRQ